VVVTKKIICGLFLLSVVSALQAQDRVGAIEFFGAKGIDIAAVRQRLPIHAGDRLTSGWKERVREAVVSTTGSEPTDIAGICCDETHSRTIFIGFKGKTYKPFSYRPPPSGKDRLPDSALALLEKEEAAIKTAVYHGDAQEDDSQGYALAKNSAARALQLKMREFAVAHGPELIAIATHAADVTQRRAATEFLGYTTASLQQVEGLQEASHDSDEEVRNNATRALGVLLSVHAEFASAINPAGVIALLYSGVWTDRNKSTFLLEQMTASREPGLLRRLREQAWDVLVEMATWKDFGHAYPSRVILGRVIGIPEDRLQKLILSGTVDELLKSGEK
jgi:hypothetical protein